MAAATLTPEKITPSFDARLQKTWDAGLESGEVVYEEATSALAMDGDTSIPFEVRYLPCLDKKPTSRSPSPDPPSQQCDAMESDSVSGEDCKESSAPVDPFAAPRDNVVLETKDYTCVLNKYALEPGHFLVVTNEFYPQRGLLRAADLAMIYETLGAPKRRRHYCFFNGGLLAGASQEHRHFQFLPVPQLKTDCWPDQLYKASSTRRRGEEEEEEEIKSHAEIPAHHFLLPIRDGSRAALYASFTRLHEAAREAIRGAPGADEDEEMPYNFLMTREYMLLMPRRNEEWDEHAIGVGGTCLIGSIMVTKARDLETVKRVGLRQMLAYVGYPKN